MQTYPRFLQGIFTFTGKGFAVSERLADELVYFVPQARRAQLIYLRAGNSSPELIALTLVLNGKVMRHFPIGAKADTHVALSVVEDIEPGSKLEVAFSAPVGVVGTVVLDLGLMEV